MYYYRNEGADRCCVYRNETKFAENAITVDYNGEFWAIRDRDGTPIAKCSTNWKAQTPPHGWNHHWKLVNGKGIAFLQEMEYESVERAIFGVEYGVDWDKFSKFKFKFKINLRKFNLN